MPNTKITEFINQIKDIVGVYFGFHMSLEQTRNWFLERQRQAASMVNEPIENMDDKPFYQYDSDTDTYFHEETQGQLKARLAERGINYYFSGSMCVVLIYQYWEDKYRSEIASDLGISKNELLSPIMGDLRWIRNSIIHHSGIAIKEIERCEILDWFSEGDKIEIDKERFITILDEIDKFIKTLIP